MQNVYDEILNYFGNELAYVDTTSVLSLYKQQKIEIDHKDFCCLYQLVMYRKILRYNHEQAERFYQLGYEDSIMYAEPIKDFSYSDWRNIRSDLVLKAITDTAKVNKAYRNVLSSAKNYASLGIDKELDCSYKPSTVLNWCGDNLYGFALRRWCNVNI